MSSNRVFYAVQSVGLATPVERLDPDTKPTESFTTVQGVQSVGLNTNFNLEPVYQLGQLELYDNYEEVPEVEITLNKVLDGKDTLYQQCMGEGTLVELANYVTAFQLSIYEDTQSRAQGNGAKVICNPAYLSSVTYTFPTEGNATEEVTLVANDKVWSSTSTASAPAESGSLQIVRRNLVKTTGEGASVIPYGASGGIPNNSRIQNITISMNLGREQIRELGRRTPYYRYINFPVEITTEFQVVALDVGDQVGAEESNTVCSNPKALANKPIKIVLCDGMTIDLGSKNKLRSVNYTGGDTGGGNATITYSYVTYNDFDFTGPSIDLTPE
jgi:hypothetical protein